MTVSNQSTVSSFTANGSATVFNFNFQVLDSSDLKVHVNGNQKVVGYDYTVSGIGNSYGGNVNFLSPPEENSVVVIYRESSLSRETDYQRNGDLRAETINYDFDRLWLVMQEAFVKFNRAPLLPIDSQISSTIDFPKPESGKYIRWNLNGTALEAVDGTGTSQAYFLQSGSGAVSRSMQSKIGDFVNVRDFGALGDGSANDTAALQAAIDYAESLGGGTVHFPVGNYLISATLTVQKGVRLVGEGQIQDSPSSSGVAEGSCIRWNSASHLDMCQIKSATFGNTLRGAGSINIVWHGSSYAKCAIRASSVMHCEFDGVSQAFTEAGLVLDNGNGVLCGLTKIPRWEHIYGSAVATEGSHGLVLDGDVMPNPTSGVTNNQIGAVTGLIKNGNMVHMRDCDGNVIQHIQASRVSGGTGRAIAFKNGSQRHARNNLVVWMHGSVLAESGTRGNNILHLNSEAADLQIDAGGQLHYNTTDYISADQWQTHRYVMSDQLLLPPGVFSTEEEFVAYVTYDPPSLADGAGAEVDITVTGAVLGDTAEASFSLDTQGINVDAQVTATNLVTVRLQNETGSTVDLGSGALRVRVNARPTRMAQRSSAGDLWDSIGFEQGFDTSAKVSVHAPYAWNDGRITAVRIVFCMSGGNASKQARLRFRAVSVAPLYSLSTPSVDDSVDITVNDNALRVQEYKHTFSTPIDYARGDYLGLRIGRVGSHANDNASGVLHLLGAHLIYEGEGPDSPGSGPYDQSVDYV
jgi:hypothetical protein